MLPHRKLYKGIGLFTLDHHSWHLELETQNATCVYSKRRPDGPLQCSLYFGYMREPIAKGTMSIAQQMSIEFQHELT